MSSPIPETLPLEIKERIASYGSLRNFAVMNQLNVHGIYGMFLNGGSQRKGLKQLVSCAQKLGVSTKTLFDIIKIEDINIRRYKINTLLTTAGIKNMIDVDIAAGLPRQTLYSFVVPRRGMRLLERCEIVSRSLGMTLEEFAEIS